MTKYCMLISALCAAYATNARSVSAPQRGLSWEARSGAYFGSRPLISHASRLVRVHGEHVNRGNGHEGGEVVDEQVTERAEELHKQRKPDNRARTVPVGKVANRNSGDQPDQARYREAKSYLDGAQVHYAGEIQRH
jgi:hypothetical protein